MEINAADNRPAILHLQIRMARRLLLPRRPAVVLRRRVKKHIALGVPGLAVAAKPLSLQAGSRPLRHLPHLLGQLLLLTMEDAEVRGLGQEPTVVSARDVPYRHRWLAPALISCRSACPTFLNLR